jgi:carboxypeptidase C (cathepsin A)
LPPDSTTKHVLALPGRTLAFTATAGSIRLFDDKSEPQADIAYTAYQLDGADLAVRPVTFVFNGGPGSASAWLQLGNAGPWRLDIDAAAVNSSSPPDLQPNAETWLDFTDLVFIDPVDRLQPICRHWRGGPPTLFLGRRRCQLDRAHNPPLAGKVRALTLAKIHRR